MSIDSQTPKIGICQFQGIIKNCKEQKNQVGNNNNQLAAILIIGEKLKI